MGAPTHDPVLSRWESERIRRKAALELISQHLQEQPSARSVRAAGRAWLDDIRGLTEAVAHNYRTEGGDF